MPPFEDKAGVGVALALLVLVGLEDGYRGKNVDCVLGSGVGELVMGLEVVIGGRP